MDGCKTIWKKEQINKTIYPQCTNRYKLRERIRTSKIRMSKVKKRTLKVQKEHQKSEHTP
jgi:hypothetical protein